MVTTKVYSSHSCKLLQTILTGKTVLHSRHTKLVTIRNKHLQGGACTHSTLHCSQDCNHMKTNTGMKI